MGRPGQLALAAALLVAAVVAAATLGGRHSRSTSHLGPSHASATPVLAATTSTSQIASTGPGAAEAATPGTSTASSLPATPGATLQPPMQACTTGGLTAAVTNLGAAVGTEYLQIALTNASRARCQLTGFPGVAFVDATGHQIGSSVGRGPGAVNTVVVAPGADGYAVVRVHDAYVTTAPSCQLTTAAGIRITAPGQATALAVAVTAIQVCANPANTGDADILPFSGQPAQS
ncbi:MAG: DUF4232 domain-containing protein [Acidimicrobiales bacterium]